MKPTQEIKDQIRKMAEAEYPIIPARFLDLNGNESILDNDALIEQRSLYLKGAEAVMERLDIDIERLIDVCILHTENKLSESETKQQILNAIKLKTQ